MAQKLSLVVDLDHTLLHTSTNKDAYVAQHPGSGRGVYVVEEEGETYYVKLRPGVSKFLHKMNHLYEMNVYTHGKRSYAEKMVQIIDPTNQFFQGRIVSQTDAPDITFKQLSRVSCSESRVVILDDTLEVWFQQVANTIRVHPFRFWASDKISDKRDDDNVLQSLTLVLKRIHSLSQEPLTTGLVLSFMRASVLRDVHILFSGTCPLECSPQNHHLWHLAQQFGAVCYEHMTYRVTHVVAARDGSQKVHEGRRRGLHVVHVNWLFYSISHFVRGKEEEFLFTSPKSIECRTDNAVFDAQLDEKKESQVSVSLNKFSEFLRARHFELLKRKNKRKKVKTVQAPLNKRSRS
jgi:RNA polymerase II subunit A-like phosphatase